MAVPDVRLCGSVPAMTRAADQPPFAVASDGSVFINAAVLLTDATDLESLVREARRRNRRVFIGIVMSASEAELAMARLDNAAHETAARILGDRRRRRRRERTQK